MSDKWKGSSPNLYLARLSTFKEVLISVHFKWEGSQAKEIRVWLYTVNQNKGKMLRQVLSQLLGSRVVFRIYWREWWSEQGRSSFCPLAQIVDAAGFLLQLVHSLPGRGQAADAVKDGELCRCCPATCVGQSFNDLRPHKIFTYNNFSCQGWAGTESGKLKSIGIISGF